MENSFKSPQIRRTLVVVVVVLSVSATLFSFFNFKAPEHEIVLVSLHEDHEGVERYSKIIITRGTDESEVIDLDQFRVPKIDLWVRRDQVLFREINNLIQEGYRLESSSYNGRVTDINTTRFLFIK